MIRRHIVIGFLTLALTISAAGQIPQASDGDLDLTFGVGGRVRYADSGGYPVWGSSSAIQSDGKVIVAGSVRGDFLLARFKVDGSPDTTFGIDGIVTTDFGQGTIHSHYLSNLTERSLSPDKTSSLVCQQAPTLHSSDTIGTVLWIPHLVTTAKSPQIFQASGIGLTP